MTPDVKEDILDVVNEIPEIRHTKCINASGCSSFDCLESVAKTTAVSIPSAACTGLVTTRFLFTVFT
jgi:hypothetical protein